METESTSKDVSSPIDQADSPSGPPTDSQDDNPALPIDPDNEALKALGHPYKRVDGRWSDGGTDDVAGTGQFRPSWSGMATISKRRWALQMAISHAVSPSDILAVMHSLLEKARKGDRHCAEMVFKYTIGDPVTLELMQRIRALEQAAGVTGGAATDARQDDEATSIVATLKLREERVA